MVRSSSSGPSSFGFVSISFRFCHRCRYFAIGADIWLDRSRFGQYLVGSIKSGLDLDEILSNLTRSGGFQVALRRKIKNISKFDGLQWISSSSLSENLWISSDFVDFMVKLGGSNF